MRRNVANCRRDFVSSEISSKRHEKHEFRRNSFALLFHNTVHVNARFLLKGENSKISSINDCKFPKVRSTLFEICSSFIQYFKHPCGHPFQSWSFLAIHTFFSFVLISLLKCSFTVCKGYFDITVTGFHIQVQII